MEYVTLKNRLSSKQSGNKKSHSTETSVIQTTDMILSAINKKQLMAVVLLDMSKAFDSINHNMPLVKLQDVGASPSAIKWFRSYLTSGHQVVTIGTAVSDRLQVINGVPQGSILHVGPLLFSIYLEHHICGIFVLRFQMEVLSNSHLLAFLPKLFLYSLLA